ncbi:MAG: T9SS type A sorting domain-containing protein, partial [Bacteroidota bacterium]
VTFTNQTSGNNTYNWNFGDSNSSNSTNPFHQYTDTGKFEITLNTTSEYGCVSKITDSVRVYEPRLDISAINLEFQEVNNFIKITGYFKNEGNLTVNNLDLYAKVDGGSFFKELWSGTLIKNGILVHEFSSQVYNPNEDTYLCVEATIPNQSIEINLSNNQFCSNMGENNFSVYNLFPNPSVNELNIPFNLTKKGIVYFSLYSAGGNLVRKFEFNAETPGIQITKMDISDLSSGIYGLNIEFEGKNIMKKILKQKKD